jgi:phytoene desaturase
MSAEKRVCIIGGGISGLAAGLFLARQGWEVKLYEANHKLGGCCGTTCLDGYTFNDGALYIALPGVLDHVFQRLGLDRPALLPLRRITAHSTTWLPDGSVVTIGDRLEVTVKKDQEFFDQAQLRIELQRLMDKWGPVLQFVVGDILPHPFSLRRLILKGWRQLPKLHGSVASELMATFSDEAVRAALSGILLYSGLPPEKNSAMGLLGLIALLAEGFYLPEGGMGRIPQVLEKALRDNGGEIHLNSSVKQILVKDGNVCGLEIEASENIETRAVISTVSGMLTFGQLLAPQVAPVEMRRKAVLAPLSFKALSVQLGLSKRIDAPSFTNNVYPMMENQYRYFFPEQDQAKWLNYTVTSLSAPELAPPGGSVVEIYPPIDQRLRVDDWGEARTERIAETAIEALSSRHSIEVAVKRVRSPRDFQSSMHLYKGAIYGLSAAAGLGAYFPHNLPIRGLYQAGQTTYPGSGVINSALSGIFAAEALLQAASKKH